MKLTIISDTHNEHEKLGTLSGEVLLHCGDMFNPFSPEDDDVERMDAWFGQQKFDLILCTGGNHDLALEDRLKSDSSPFKNATYLQDQSFVYRGITFYGSPWTPDLRSHAFYQDDAELQKSWSAIPPDTDVLITHTPPAGILDVSSRGLELGCDHLAGELQRISPQLHCFGHVHASSGACVSNGISFINAAAVNSQFKLTRQPYEFSIQATTRTWPAAATSAPTTQSR